MCQNKHLDDILSNKTENELDSPVGSNETNFAKLMCFTIYVFLKIVKQIHVAIKVRKTTRIRNRYNLVLQLSQDTKWESYKITTKITNKSQEVSPFPSGTTFTKNNGTGYIAHLHWQCTKSLNAKGD